VHESPARVRIYAGYADGWTELGGKMAQQPLIRRSSPVFLMMISMFLSACNEEAKLNVKLKGGSMKAPDNSIVLEFPLRGEWFTPNTPAKRIPSHGTDELGARYAYDFLQVDWKRAGKPFYEASSLRYLLLGVSLAECYGWGEEIYAPCDGVIVKAEDGYPERKRVHWVSDLYVALRSAVALKRGRSGIRQFAGNYVIMQCKGGLYAAFAHMQEKSISVSVGEKVKQGQLLGKVGHSGNSTAPHLHFQLMDSDDLNVAKGTPCAFRDYEVFKDGAWRRVDRGIPSDKDRIRYNGQPAH
jgi:murein DD-endopeptidase MepM/ murein hydrolase activator NlpD